MPRRRLIAIVVAVALVPLVAFVTARSLLDRADDGSTSLTGASGTSTTAEPPTTTTEPPTTTSSTTSTVTAPPGGGLPPVPRPGEPVAAADDRGLAAQIRTSEAAIRDPATAPAELTRQAHVQQVAFRALVNQPERTPRVLALLEPDLRAVTEANVTAGAKLRAMLKEPKTTLPEWRIIPPAPAEELLGHYREAEATVGVPWEYLAAIHLVETRMGRIRGDSEAGAQGPMQFLPRTWAAYGNGGDIQSNRDSIHAAARYLKHNGAPERPRDALFAYNRDTRYVDAVLAYAERMRADERAYYGYHQWQVYYVTIAGDVWLPEGFVNT